MAKRKQALPAEVVYISGDVSMIASPSFIYEIEIFVCKDNRSYNLQDTVLVKSKTNVVPKQQYKSSKGETAFEYCRMVGAPKTWLDDNGYTEKTT